jgi:hypothetical protein
VKAIYALYPDGHGAQRAVNRLRAAGVADADITVISSAPMDDFEFSRIGGTNKLWHAASLGGFLGLVGSTALTVSTSRAWPINVGNMPTVAWWPFLIPIFEVTMLGAILATALTLIVTAGLGRRRPALYDPAVSDGQILVGIESPAETKLEDLKQALLSTPGVSLKTISV